MKKKKQQLELSRDQYKIIFKSTPNPLYIWKLIEKNFILINYNKASEKIINIKTKDVIGVKARDFYKNNPEVLEALNQSVNERKQISKELNYTFETIKKEMIVNISCVFIPPDLVLVYLEDISERKLTEQKLLKSEEKYRLISENANDLLLVLNYNFEFEYINKESYLSILGFSDRDLIGKSILTFIHPEDVNPALKSIKAIFEIGEVFDEYRFKNKKGEYLWFEFRGKAFTNSEGVLKGLIISRDISKQKKAEKKLEESEEKFRTITEQLLMGVCILQDDVIKYVNKKYADICGYTVEEMMNWKQKEYIKAIHPEDLNMVVEQAAKKQRGDKDVIIHYPFRGVKKTGETIWVDNYAKTILYNGRPADLITVIDITERKYAEQLLKSSEQKYRHLYERSPFSVVLVDSEGKIVDCNPATEELIQYKKEEILNKKFTDLTVIPQTYMPILIERFKRFYNAGILSPIEVQLHRKDGSIIWIRMQSSLINLGDTILNQVIGYDITERKKTEQELKESTNRFQRIFEVIPDLFFLVSGDTTIIDYKGKEEELYVPPESFLGKRLIDILPEKLSKLTFNTIKKTITTQKPQIIEYSLPIKGKTQYYEAHHLYFSENQVAIFIRNITKRKQAEVIVKEELKKSKLLDKIRKNLITRVSHELKTPIMSILGSSELLLNAYSNRLEKDKLDLIETMQRGGKRLEELVNNLLDISKTEYNKLELIKKFENLSEIIRECSKEMQFQIRERKITFNLEVPEKLFVNLDQKRIEQVIIN